MTGESLHTQPHTRSKDGQQWRVGTADDVAWIEDATDLGPEILSGIPPGFAAYCTLALPKRMAHGVQAAHDRAVVPVLEAHSSTRNWWLGYLETGIGTDVVLYDAPRVKLYDNWDYVLVCAGPEQALGWRPSEGHGAPFKGALPDLLFPADHAWLYCTLWDDNFGVIGGPEELAAAFLNDPELGSRVRRVTRGELRDRD
ncbi:MAG: hypothetical protein ACLP50_12810 [Solirubrobacteraceae bacterium]